jgi:hypothetical protein
MGIPPELTPHPLPHPRIIIHWNRRYNQEAASPQTQDSTYFDKQFLFSQLNLVKVVSSWKGKGSQYQNP